MVVRRDFLDLGSVGHSSEPLLVACEEQARLEWCQFAHLNTTFAK